MAKAETGADVGPLTKIAVWLFFAALLGIFIYGFYVTMEWGRVRNQTYYYNSCHDRGGTVNEGSFGLECIGPKRPR